MNSHEWPIPHRGMGSVVIGKPIRTEIGSGIFSSGSVQNGSEPFSSKEP